MTDRFRIIEKSVSHHCCFVATVVEFKPDGKDTYCIETYGFDFETVCECFEHEDAVKICEALNATSKGLK